MGFCCLGGVIALCLAVLTLSVRGDETLYNDSDRNIVTLATMEEYDQQVRPSPSIWMIQFYDPSSRACQVFAQSYKDLGQIMNGVFPFAVVDRSTADGQTMIQKLGLDATAGKTSAENDPPTIYTVIPQPWNNSESIPQRFTGDMFDAGQHLFNYLNRLATKRGELLGVWQGKPKSADEPGSDAGMVLELNESNFDTHVLQNKNIVAVAFTAPWCGHCNKLQPEWHTAAAALAKEGVVLGWVDATANPGLAATFQVQSYPTIKIFPAGTPKTPAMAQDYTGPRDAAGIISTLLLEAEKSGFEKEILELTHPEMMTEHCGGRNHICVLAVLPHILDSGAEGRDKYRHVLAQVSKSFRASAFSFLWLELGAQPDLEQKLELTFGAPALVAYSMDRQAYAVLRAAFTEKSITGFLHSITTGRQRTIPLSELPTVVATEPWNGQDAPPVEEEMSLSDIMGDDEF